MPGSTIQRIFFRRNWKKFKKFKKIGTFKQIQILHFLSSQGRKRFPTALPPYRHPPHEIRETPYGHAELNSRKLVW
jgi:hypothetical protein